MDNKWITKSAFDLKRHFLTVFFFHLWLVEMKLLGTIVFFSGDKNAINDSGIISILAVVFSLFAIKIQQF